MSDRRPAPNWRRVRPIDPAWQLTQRECWAMLSRAHFTRFVVARIVRRRLPTEAGPIVVRRMVA